MRLYILFITHLCKSCYEDEVINCFIGFSLVLTIMKPECFTNNNGYVLPLALQDDVISILEPASWSTEWLRSNVFPKFRFLVLSTQNRRTLIARVFYVAEHCSKEEQLFHVWGWSILHTVCYWKNGLWLCTWGLYNTVIAVHLARSGLWSVTSRPLLLG